MAKLKAAHGYVVHAALLGVKAGFAHVYFHYGALGALFTEVYPYFRCVAHFGKPSHRLCRKLLHRCRFYERFSVCVNTAEVLRALARNGGKRARHPVAVEKLREWVEFAEKRIFHSRVENSRFALPIFYYFRAADADLFVLCRFVSDAPKLTSRTVRGGNRFTVDALVYSYGVALFGDFRRA